MGVDLSPLIKDVKKEIDYRDLTGKRIAIDAFNQIYQFLAVIRGNDGDPLKDLEGNITSHLAGLLNRTTIFIENDIKPIFVFDGKPNELKAEEIQQRKEKKEEALQKMQTALEKEDYEEAKKYAQGTSRLTSHMVDQAKALLKAMGCPVVQALQDGEAQAAYLVQKGDAWAVGSQDYDSLLFGAPRFIRNLSASRTRRFKNTRVKVKLEYYSHAKVLEALELSQQQMIDLGILVGVDFFEGIKGIGPKTAYKYIQQYESIEQIIAEKIEVRGIAVDLDLALVEKIRNIFLNPVIQTDLPEIKWDKPNYEKITEILVETHNFSADRVEGVLDRLRKKYSAGTQSSLLSFVK